MIARILSIAGSDSGGGAGIQADIKTIAALGGYAMTAVTAVTAQNTLGVFGVVTLEPGFVGQQIRLVIQDLGVDALKTGMLAHAPMIAAVADAIQECAPNYPLVVDPVMIAKGGAALLDPAALALLRQRLMPMARLVTPNLPEAECLLDRRIADLGDMQAAARALVDAGAQAVLLKGGHLDGPMVHDVLADAEGMQVFSAPRLISAHTHGTGCTLASAIATGLGQGLSLTDSVMRARHYVRCAIAAAPGFGRGHGPLFHGVSV